MNDDDLSVREHAQLRGILIEGTHRIRRRGAHRAQIIAGAVAFALVAAVTGGAFAAAGLGSAQPRPVASPSEPAPTRTSTPTPIPTPTPTPTEALHEGVSAFGGACANALSDAEVTSAIGRPMALSEERWLTGEYRALGGIDCFWTSADEYNAASVSLRVYPAAAVPAAVVENTAAAGCQPQFSVYGCIEASDRDGVWLLVHAVDTAHPDTASAARTLHDSARSRVALFPLPIAAQRSAAWWTIPDCGAVAAELDPASLGFRTIGLTPDAHLDPGEYVGDPSWIPDSAGVARWCSFSASTDDGRWASVMVRFIAGGAADLGTAASAEGSRAIAVPGAAAAFVAPDNARLDGGADMLLVSDGVNTMVVVGSDDSASPPDAFVGFASALLALMTGAAR